MKVTFQYKAGNEHGSDDYRFSHEKDAQEKFLSMKEIIDWYYSKHIDISDIIKDGNAVEMPEKIYNEIFQ